MTPYETDEIISTAATRAGYEAIRRFRRVNIADVRALPRDYMKWVPDTAKIQRHLQDGIDVPGCSLANDQYEYTLSKLETKETV